MILYWYWRLRKGMAPISVQKMCQLCSVARFSYRTTEGRKPMFRWWWCDTTMYTTTTTTTILWPFVQVYLGEPVPEETLTHSHLSWSSTILYQLPPSTTIYSILPVHLGQRRTLDVKMELVVMVFYSGVKTVGGGSNNNEIFLTIWHTSKSGCMDTLWHTSFLLLGIVLQLTLMVYNLTIVLPRPTVIIEH